MKKGIFEALLFYFLGFGIAITTYLIYGHPYIHAPGIHHFIILITLIIGFIWMIISLLFVVIKKNSKHKGMLTVHFTILFSCFLYFYFSIKPFSKKESITESNSVKTIKKKDSILIYHNSNLVFLKVKDSVHLDLR
ncbi:hypothetical protein [Pontimicrobium sp. IMCC45349]|uniref:hypothetical protein n=1 Tax=Pontimicrobium sp. IMCC45349 TaxID=3391574 RepID=UPI00399F4270